MGSDISGKTLGLIGVGKIGKSMARMAGAGFGAKVLGYNPNMPREAMQAAGVEKCDDLQAMLQQCDFVSVHCVLNDSTHHLIGADELACMKPSAMLINVSRGAIVDEVALVKALQNGAIAGAALDVYSIEPLNHKDHPMRVLFNMDNVILSPHLTFYTGRPSRTSMQRANVSSSSLCMASSV